MYIVRDKLILFTVFHKLFVNVIKFYEIIFFCNFLLLSTCSITFKTEYIVFELTEMFRVLKFIIILVSTNYNLAFANCSSILIRMLVKENATPACG